MTQFMRQRESVDGDFGAGVRQSEGQVAVGVARDRVAEGAPQVRVVRVELHAVGGGDRVPFIRIGQGSGHPKPVLVQDGEVELRVRQPLRGGQCIPSHCFDQVARQGLPFVVEDAQGVLRIRVALVGRTLDEEIGVHGPVSAARACRIGRDLLALRLDVKFLIELAGMLIDEFEARMAVIVARHVPAALIALRAWRRGSDRRVQRRYVVEG